MCDFKGSMWPQTRMWCVRPHSVMRIQLCAPCGCSTLPPSPCPLQIRSQAGTQFEPFAEAATETFPPTAENAVKALAESEAYAAPAATEERRA